MLEDLSATLICTRPVAAASGAPRFDPALVRYPICVGAASPLRSSSTERVDALQGRLRLGDRRGFILPPAFEFGCCPPGEGWQRVRAGAR